MNQTNFHFTYKFQLYKTPFQRIMYREFEGTPTFSSLELFPHSPILQEIYSTALPYSNTLIISCEITIFHIYHKNLQQRIFLTDLFITTTSSSMMGWDRKKTGDPDNSALTGSSPSTFIGMSNVAICLLIVFSLNFHQNFYCITSLL